MKLPVFDYHAPSSLDDVLYLLGKYGPDGNLLAGGQSLIPLMALRLARPAVLIDLGPVPGLSGIRLVDDVVCVGATVRESATERSSLISDNVPLLAAALPFIGHPAIRSRGTIGGTVAHADPSAEVPAVALALDAEILVRSAARGDRVIPAAEFFAGFLSTTLDDDEALIEVRFPVTRARTGVCFREVARRPGDFAIVGTAVQLQLDPNDRIESARIAVLGVSDKPVRCTGAEEAITGAAATEHVVAVAGQLAANGLNPPTDLHGTSAYRTHLVRVLVERAVTTAFHRAAAVA